MLGSPDKGKGLMRRREFVKFVGGAVAAWPITALAQRPLPTIGFLSSGAERAFAPNVAGFVRGLQEIGYSAGQNVAVTYRWADGQYDRLPAMAAELAQLQVAVLVASGGTAVARAAKAATGDHTDRFRHRRRSGCQRYRRQPEPARRKHHRSCAIEHRACGEAPWTAA